MVNPLEKLWKDKLSVAEYHEITKPNGSTGFKEVLTLENVPCKLSFSTLQAVNPNDTNATVVQTAKVFCNPSVL